MLRNDLVADLFTQYFNEAGKEFDKVFEVYDSATDYKIVKPGSIVGILSEMGGLVKPVMNYVNTTCNYELKLLYSVERGFGEIKKLNQIADSVIKAINGVPLQLSGGQAIITFSQHHTGDYNDRPRIGWSVTPKLTFKVEYSQKQDGLRYEMALIDTPFDMTTQDTRYFNSQSEQQTYYLNKVAESGVPFCEMMAPNVNSLTLQQQVYINDLRYYPSGTTKVKDLNEILMKNYAIIRAMDGDTAVAYYYYWVQNANVGDNNQALLDLKMDTIQTWHFDPDIVYSDCMIHKAHLNRWIDNGDGTVSFDGTINSKLFEREDIQNVAKRLTSRKIISVYNTGDNILDAWLEEHINAWIYIYISGNKSDYISYKVDDSINATQYQTQFNKIQVGNKVGGSPIPQEVSVLCYPLYKINGSNIYVYNSNNQYCFSISRMSANRFFDLNGGNENIYSIKVSIVPPFNNYDFPEDYTIDGDNLYIHGTNYNSITSDLTVQTNAAIRVTTPNDNQHPLLVYRFSENMGANTTGYGLFNVQEQDDNNLIIETKPFLLNHKFNFNKNEIINSNKNLELNPKLLSSDYTSLKVSDVTENGFEYEVQKLNNQNITLQYIEALTPDFTKTYISVKSESEIYTSETNENLTGFIGTNDSTLMLTTTHYREMIANNKNFFLQNTINRGFDLANTLVSVGAGAIAGGGLGIVAGAGAALNLANIVKNKISERLSIDNLKSAPEMITAAKGNVIFENIYTEQGIIVEEWEALPNEKIIINDYMDMYGFTYNQVDNIKNCDNIRYYHNYIEADLTNIKGISISNTIRDDIKNRFSQGIRFWNTDNIQYTLENYEISLIN